MEAEKYKILIADDEYWTREKLRRMIDWEQYQLDFLEPAVDGEDVLRKMEEHHPDIVITDINMPYLDGVELLKILQERYPDTITFVISGYDDFTYARETFMAGSINYLVKPVTKIELISAVSRALELISRRKEQKQETLKAASFMQDMEFSQLLAKKDNSFLPNITMNASLDYAGVTLILLKIQNMNHLSGVYHYDMNLLSRSVKKMLHEIIREDSAIIFNHVYRSNEFIIVSEKENQELKLLARKIVKELEEKSKSPITVVFSDHSFSMDSIWQAYVQAVSLLMTRTYIPVSQILFPDHKALTKEEIRHHFSEEQKNELTGLIKRKQSADVKRMIFHEIGLADCEKEKWQYLEVRQTVKRVINFVQESCSGRLDMQSGAGIEDIAEILDKELELLDIGYVCELIGDFIDDCIAIGQDEPADTIRGIVHQAADYIKEHYYEQLTLGLLAQKYHVESTYFSRMFRKETGTNLLQFIARTRIEKAKEYIRKGNNNLTEIAFLVGYDDYTYFNKVFRKMEGMSPRDYKSSNLSNH